MTVKNIAILVFPDTSASVVYGLYDLLISAGRDWGVITEGTAGPELLCPLLVAREAGPLIVSNGIFVTVDATLEDCPAASVICVPEVNLPPGAPLAERFQVEIEWLQQRFAGGAVLAATCSGAMLFAEAGLLDGHEATTHWAWCEILNSRFPEVKVQPQRALVVAGDGQRLIMAGGGTSYLDLALYLIARMTDVETAMQVARLNLIDWHHIGQQPFARLSRTRQVEDAVIARCQTWIAEHYDESNPVSNLVSFSGLAERTFKRRFQLATGMTPLEYVQSLRLEEAKHLLETTTQAVESVANEVGYGDSGYFGRLFKNKVKITPAQYRRRFGSVRKSLQKPESFWEGRDVAAEPQDR